MTFGVELVINHCESKQCMIQCFISKTIYFNYKCGGIKYSLTFYFKTG